MRGTSEGGVSTPLCAGGRMLYRLWVLLLKINRLGSIDTEPIDYTSRWREIIERACHKGNLVKLMLRLDSGAQGSQGSLSAQMLFL
jgi:hypothetical protein